MGAGGPCDAVGNDGTTLTCDARSVVMANGRLAIACGDDATVAIVDPADLSLVDTVDVGGTPSDLAWSGSLLLVAAGEAGLVAVDPTEARVVAGDLGAACGAGLPAAAVAVHEGHAIIVAYDLGMRPGAAPLLVVDLADPLAPLCSGSGRVAGPAWDVAVAGERAYVAGDEEGLVVFDVACR